VTTFAIFGAITSQSQDFLDANLDGIMGLSYGTNKDVCCESECIPTVFDFLVGRTDTRNAFGLYLDYGEGGSLSIGDPDPSLFTGDFILVSLRESQYYSLDLNGLSIDGVLITESLGQDLGETIVESATTSIMLPAALYKAFKGYITTQRCDLTATCYYQNIFSGYCLTQFEDVLSFPDITFIIDNQTISVPPASYFLPSTTLRGNHVYCLGIQSWTKTHTVLGYSFLRGKYVYFDRDNHVLGVAGTNADPALSAATKSLQNRALVFLFIFLACVGWT